MSKMSHSFHKKLLLFYAVGSVIIVADKILVLNLMNSVKPKLESCNQWLIDNQLSLHVGKTVVFFLAIVKLKCPSDFIKIKYNGTVVKKAIARFKVVY